MFLVLKIVMKILVVVLLVPFFTLLERKVMGYMQLRKGPKKVGFLGLLQAISDGLKLISKNFIVLKIFNLKIFFFSPVMAFLIMIMIWFYLFPVLKKSVMKLSIVLFICLSSIKVYTMLGSGWGSNSKYSLLGSMRGAVQVISYEVCLVLILFMPCSLQCSYNLVDYLKKYSPYVMIFFFVFIMWLVSMLAETNRCPFDFSEGESELVSGFKTEYSSIGFVMLFLSEYGKIIFISFLTILLFMPIKKYFFFLMLGKMMGFFFVWIRACLPRFRYDLLMKVMWKGFLPFSMFNLLMIFSI